MDAGIINYAVYEDGSEFMGIANVTLPDQVNKTLAVNGAGIAGDVNMPIPGHKEAMTCTISFRNAPEAAYKLCESRRHILDLRVAHEDFDTTAGQIKVKPHKHILEVIPTKMTGGTLAPSAAQAASGEYSVISIKTYIDGKLVLDFDPMRWRDVDASGNDNLAAVRSALGK